MPDQTKGREAGLSSHFSNLTVLTFEYLRNHKTLDGNIFIELTISLLTVCIAVDLSCIAAKEGAGSTSSGRSGPFTKKMSDSFDGEDTMKSSAICVGMAIVSKCKMSSEVRASDTKVTQRQAMDVGDIPGHQLSIYEEDTDGRSVHSGVSSW